MMKQQSGFTLIELIMVIVILGILAATAMPKFSDLSGEARIAKVNAMKAAMQSAATMAHGTQLAQGVNPNSAVTINQGLTIISMVNGYPQAAFGGILSAVETSDYYTGAWSTSGVSADMAHIACAVSYVEAAVAGIPTYILHSAPADCS
jgi:MSHA pilin protein MshA